MAAVRLLFAGRASGSDVARICGLTAEMVNWLHDSRDYENGTLLVSPPVIEAQPARWLSSMRWIAHCKATVEAERLERSRRGS